MRAVSPLLRVALAAISVAAPALRAQDPGVPTFANVTVHDPSVVRDGSTYYVFGSHMAAASTTDLMHWTQIPSSMTSSSLINNGTPLVEFSAAFAYSTVQDFWAPDAIKLGDGNYYHYYCTCQGSSPLSALGLAKASAVTGPYSNVSLLLKSAGTSPTVSPYDVNTMPNVVDPSVFFDNTGRLWMVYGSFSGGIFILELDKTVGSPTIGQPLPGQGYGKKLIGGNSSRIEGSYITYSSETGYYYLFMTFGGLGYNAGYNIRVGRSPNPDGPYLDAAGNDLTNVKATITNDAPLAPYGVKLMGNWQFLHASSDPLSTSRGYVSPGGCSIVREAGTGKYILVFHTRFFGGVGGNLEAHEVRTHQMYLNVDGWFVAAPHRYAGETLTTTEVSQIPGNYKLINLGNDTPNTYPGAATVNSSVAITLNADNSVSGGVTGTWALTGDHYATLVLSGVTYRGVWARQWDDDNQRWVLAFTALSNTNVNVWGSKYAATSTVVPPAIVTHPADQATVAGSATTFSVGATGTTAFTYQWQFSTDNGSTWTALVEDGSYAGSTAGTLSVTPTGAMNGEKLRCVVSNAAGYATSNAATLAVTVTTFPPAITTQPVSQTVNAGAAVTFTAAASGNPAPAYQWRKNGMDVSGATNSSYSINAVTSGDAGSYTVLATNSVSSALSNPAILTVIVPPSDAIITITVQ